MSHGPYFVSSENAVIYHRFCEKPYSFHVHAGLHVHCVIGLYRYKSQYRPNTRVGVAFTKTNQHWSTMTRYTCTCTIYTGLYTGLTYTIGTCTWDKHARPMNFTDQTASYTFYITSGHLFSAIYLSTRLYLLYKLPMPTCHYCIYSVVLERNYRIPCLK